MRLCLRLWILLVLCAVLQLGRGQCFGGCWQCFWDMDPYGCYYCNNNFIGDNYSWWYFHCYCPDGTVDQGQDYCLPCKYQCATCNYNPSACTTCSSGTRPSTPACACAAGYYDVGQPTCQPCNYKCATCVSAATTCTSCSSGTRPSTPGCACANGLYDAGQPTCQPCNYKCSTCVSAATTCTSCSSGTRPSTPGCACAAGYYETGQVTCPHCSYQCATCVSAATTCTSCPATRSGTPACACSAGYYEVGQAVCPLCHYSCTTCSAAGPNACTSCSGTQRYLSGSSCLCNNPYYDNGSANACQPCHYSCAACTNATACTVCDVSKQRYFASTSAYCLCLDNYYDSGALLCVACHVTCYRCSGPNSNQCTACNGIALRTLSGSTCLCANGYYAQSTSVITCLQCAYTCLTCSAAGTTSCSSCNATLSRTLSASQCPCNAGYFQNATQLCETCNPSCATCTNKTACVTCIASQGTVLNATNLCSCTSVQYYTGTVCSACNYKCLTCTGTATNCTSCPNSAYRVYKANACNCQNNYYDSGAVVCSGCAYSCLTCSSALSTACLSCNPASLRTLASATCSCPSGYYDDGANSTCNPCSYKCLTCGYASNCTTCSAAKFRSLSASTHFCECLSTYFQSSQVCYPCLSVCLTCTNNLTCSTCSSALFLTLSSNNLCICATGYYNSSGTCLPCLTVCSSCAAAATCLVCATGLNRVFNTVTSTCDCASGYVLNTTSNLCLGCQYSCQTCITSFTNQCSVCNSSHFRSLNASSKQCPCNTGYYDPGSNPCLPCSYTCYTCIGTASNCTACPAASNRTLNAATGACPCNQHYYDTIVVFVQSASCAICNYACSSCTNASACLTCNATNYRQFDGQNVECICAQGYYDTGVELCVACPYTCSSCTNSSACLTCSSVWNRATPASLCPCINNFYESGVSVCAACHYSCKTCTNSSKCVSCESNYNRALNGSSGLCSCLTRYYDSGIQICSACSYSCLTCATGPTHCLSCTASAFRTLAASACPCNNGYYDAAVEQCRKCNYTCFTCGNSLSCLSCSATNHRALSPSTGLCYCTDGYYDDNTTQPCVRCSLTCLTCINGTTCRTCDPVRFRTYNTTANYAGVVNKFCGCFYGYYSLGDGNACAQCKYPCSECSGPNANNCLYCDPASMRTLTASGTCKCNTGYYDTNSTNVCPPCSPACSSCWDALTTTCFTCSPAFFMMPGKSTCYAVCPTYYFGNTSAMICQLCSTHCLACTDSSTCTRCESPTFLDLAACVSVCRITYYANATVRECLPCRVGCANCSSSSNCFICTNSSFYVDQATTQCLQCSSLCVSCFGPTASQCLNCTYPLFLNSQYSCTPLQCPYGQYVDTFLGCVNCSQLFPNALTCNISQALLCHATTQLSLGRCVACGQVSGYAMDSAGDCNQICGDGVLIRYQCDDGNTRNGDGCSANCIIEQGWTCANVSGRSKCSLTAGVAMTLKSTYKYPRQNRLRIALQISLPLYLTSHNFFLNVVGLSAGQYEYSVEEQSASDLTEIALVLGYRESIQSKAIVLSYSEGSRRLLEREESGFQLERRLATISFQTQVTVAAFPPANFISASSTNFYSIATAVIYYLSIGLVCVNFIIVPTRYGLHSLSLAWLVPFIYTTYYRATSYSTEWVSSTVADLHYPALFGGLSLGDCCVSDSLKGMTSQVFENAGYMFAGIVVMWGLLLLAKLVGLCCGSAQLSKVQAILRYYLLTLHLAVFLQLAYSSLYAIANYRLANRIDAGNITFSLFVVLASGFLVVTLWYTTATSRFEGTEEELHSKAATHNTKQENSSRTEERQCNQIINVSQIRQTTRYNESNFYLSGTFKSQRPSSSSTLKEKDGLNERAESVLSGDKEMGGEYSLFPYDYCLLYKNNDSRSKYYLPLLLTKLLSIAILTAATQNAFYLMAINTLISLIFSVYLMVVRPFTSTFTNARIIIIEALVGILNGAFCVYQFYALSKTYVQVMQMTILVGMMVILGLSVLFSLVEHYRIWIHKIWSLCDGCFLYFRLLGKSQKVYDSEDKKREQIQVEAISQGEVVQSDAFYARVLKKQALNGLYKKERMIPRHHLEKDFL